LALLIEQARPLGRSNPIHSGLRAWARAASRNFDAGRLQHGWVTWSLAVLFPAPGGAGRALALVVLAGWPVAMLWNVAVLYVTLGFRQFSHHFTDIRDALEGGDEARERWRSGSRSCASSCRAARSCAMSSSTRCWPRTATCSACWPAIRCWPRGPGAGGGRALPHGRVRVPRYWRYRNRMGQQAVSEALQRAAAQAWTVIDWVPRG
jgi:adenosylcobinamide-phosphate synthase